MSSKALDHAPGQDWIAIVRKSGTSEFATAFVAHSVLYASVLNAPCIGVERIGAFFAATGGMYDIIAFTHETKDRSKTFLEWEGKVFGEDVAGTTILTRDEAGLTSYRCPLLCRAATSSSRKAGFCAVRCPAMISRAGDPRAETARGGHADVQ